MPKNIYTCCVCDVQFTNKQTFNKHERRCGNMEIDSKASKKTRKNIPSAVRFALWNATFGENQGQGACHCCARRVTQQCFEAGHIIAASRGGSDSVSNLRVICVLCNRSMGNTNMDDFIAKYRSIQNSNFLNDKSEMPAAT